MPARIKRADLTNPDKKSWFTKPLVSTVLQSATAAVFGLSSAFLAAEVTDGSGGVGSVDLSLAFKTEWLYISLVAFSLMVWVANRARKVQADVMRYADPEYRKALIAQAYMQEALSDREMLRRDGHIKPLAEVIEHIQETET